MLLRKVDICRATACSHEWLAFLNLLLQFLGLAAGCLLGSIGNLDNIVETYGLHGTVYLCDRLAELRQHCRCDHGNDLLSFAHLLQYVKYFALVEYGTERACIKALATVNALLGVDVLDTILILRDSLYRTCLLARYGHVYDGMVRAHLMTFATTYALVMVNVCFVILVVVYGILGTVGVAWACDASTAQIRYLVVDFHARRTSLVHHMEHCSVLHFNSLALHHALYIAAQRVHFAMLILHGKTKHSHGLVLDYGTLLVDAASSFRLLVAWIHLVWHTVNLVKERIFLPHCNQFLQKFITHKHYIIIISH